MRNIWAGAISFGLVVIPVKLYAATEQRDITFRQVHRKDGARIQFRRVCTLDGEEVPYSDIAKGYELPTGDMVVLTDEDLADLPLVTAHRIEVLHFAPAAQVEAIYSNKSYYTEPEQAGVRAYALFRDALEASGKVAVARRGAQARLRLPGRGRRGPVAGAEDGRVAHRHDDRGLRARSVQGRVPRGARGRRPGQDRGQRHRPAGWPGPARGQEAARRPDRDPAGQRGGGQGRRPRQVRRGHQGHQGHRQAQEPPQGQRVTEPIPHWPGRLVSLGDHEVFVRSAPVPDTDAEPALFVHGLEGSSRNGTDLIDLLRSRLACEAMDLPGFGDSPPRPDGRYSIAALAQSVIALIQRQSKPVHLIGNSLGGAVAVKVAATRPDLINTLTLISPALPDLRPRLDLVRFPVVWLPRLGPRLIRQYQAALPPERRGAAVIATCYSNPGLYPQARFAAEVAELGRRDSLEYAVAALMGSARALSAEFLRKGRHSPWRDVARITAPSLVIYGQHDRLVDPRAAGRAAHVFTDARIVVLPRTGHVAQMERPGLVAVEIGILLGIPDGFRRLTQERAGEGNTQPVRY